MTGNQEGGRRKRRSNEEIKRLVTEFGAGDATEPVLPQSWFGVEHRSRLLPFIPVSLEEGLAFSVGESHTQRKRKANPSWLFGRGYGEPGELRAGACV